MPLPPMNGLEKKLAPERTQSRSSIKGLRVEPIGASNSTVPEPRALYRAFLVAKARIDHPIALGIALGPLEVVEKGPSVKGANASSIGDPASQFRQHFAVPLDTTSVGYAAVLLFIGTIEIPAAAFSNFDDRVGVLS